MMSDEFLRKEQIYEEIKNKLIVVEEEFKNFKEELKVR